MKFLNRIAVISNICFFLLIPLTYIHYVEQYQWLAATILILAVLAIILNVIVLISSLLAVIFGKKHTIPKVLFFINLICFVVQVAFYFYLNTKH
ncbi:MAG: hypothetical protein NTZ59_08075 [Bacteroidetes bacterium]|jgi:hypothetical protein|nr:hypothetical protein [Bacteroidota bacterium]